MAACHITSEQKSAIILGSAAVVEAPWTVVNLSANGGRFVRYLGFAPHRSGSLVSWIAGALVVGLFVALALRLPSVREQLLRPSLLKLLAIAVAVFAGILEEVVFRRWTMNWLQSSGHGAALQVLGSALLFGLAHAIWGLMGGSARAALGAMLATCLLGGMLAVVFLLAGRSLAPCIAAHFFINLLIEPGLVLAATRGEMGAPRSN